MFADIDRHMREWGVGDLSVGKHVKAVAQSFYAQAGAAEPALAAGDAATLAPILARNVYEAAPSAASGAADLAAYLIDQAAWLDGLPGAALLAGEATFRPAEVTLAAGRDGLTLGPGVLTYRPSPLVREWRRWFVRRPRRIGAERGGTSACPPPGEAALSDKPELSRPSRSTGCRRTGSPSRSRPRRTSARVWRARFDLVALDALEAEGIVRPLPERSLIEVEGRLRASAGAALRRHPGSGARGDRHRVPRVFARGRRDRGGGRDRPRGRAARAARGAGARLGEIVAEELSLALDPYPRAPGADAVLAEVNTGAEDQAGVFAPLAALRRH